MKFYYKRENGFGYAALKSSILTSHSKDINLYIIFML
jgi:hypothetical protein